MYCCCLFCRKHEGGFGAAFTVFLCMLPSPLEKNLGHFRSLFQGVCQQVLTHHFPHRFAVGLTCAFDIAFALTDFFDAQHTDGFNEIHLIVYVVTLKC